jgi:hypothetical protein
VLTPRKSAVALLASVTAALCLLLPLALVGAPPASAHPLSTTTIRLDVGPSAVEAIVDLPLDQLSTALHQDLDATSALEPSRLVQLRGYVRDHLSAADAPRDAGYNGTAVTAGTTGTTGQGWVTSVSGGAVVQVDGADNLELTATLTPSSGSVGDFVLHYDAIIEALISHRAFVSARYGTTGTYATLAMLSWQTTSVPVLPSTTPPASQGFTAAIRLGVDHISSGSDHLLFLIMLLLPAPLLVRRRRWVRRPDRGRATLRVIHVVTAFAVGHSVTLALGALGWVHLPTRLIESGIALSVLVSALHAIRPIVRRGEVYIAGGFGLLHGLAFAALLTELDLSRSGLVTTLLGFNLGIEITQLLVVALVMPSLIALSGTVIYPALRITAAGLGAVLATAWLSERSGLTDANPFEPVADLLVDHPYALATALALLALGVVSAQRRGFLPDPINTPAAEQLKSQAPQPSEASAHS